MSSSGGQGRRVTVVGATGIVGGQLVELLQERAFPFSELKLFASESGASETIELAGRDHPVHELHEPSQLKGFDIAFLAVPQSCASDIVRARPGPLLVDLSSANRIPSKWPMAGPGLTPRDRVATLSSPVIELPHPTAHAVSIILGAIQIEPAWVGVVVQLSASSAGKHELKALFEQSAALLNGTLEQKADQRQLAFNLFPDERRRELGAIVAAQIDRLMGRSANLMIQVLQAPVFHGTLVSLFIPGPIDGVAIREKLRAAPGLLLTEDEAPPGAVDVTGQEALVISLEITPAGAAICCAFDNARRAALSALWIAECLLPAGQSTMS